jgi:hypothetical protein
MGKKLLVLVSGSAYDWDILKRKAGWPGRLVNYIECDTGRACGTSPIDSNRLLCAVKFSGHRLNDTKLVTTAVEQCSAWEEKVIGTHTRLEAPEKFLDLDSLPGVPAHNYSTNSRVYDFVHEWCTLLAGMAPLPERVADGYDKFFNLLSGRVSGWPCDIFSERKHDLENVLLPLRTDIYGLKMRRFDPDYTNDVRAAYKSPLGAARTILYDGPASLTAMLESLPGATEQTLASIRSLVARLRALIPPADESVPSSPLFVSMVPFLAALADHTAGPQQIEQLAPKFLEWDGALQKALDDLGQGVRAASGLQAAPQAARAHV